MINMEKMFKNPVHGKLGFEGAEKPEFLTRKEVITWAAESAVGTCQHIPSHVDEFINWLRGETGDEELNFGFDDFSESEENLVYGIVENCPSCGWNYSTDDFCDCGDDRWDDSEDEDEDDEDF